MTMIKQSCFITFWRPICILIKQLWPLMSRICFQRCLNATLLTATKTYLKSRSTDGSKTSIGVKWWASRWSHLLSQTSTRATLARIRRMRKESKRTLLLACNRSIDPPETWPMFQGVILDVRATISTHSWAYQLSSKTERPSSGRLPSSVSSWTRACRWTNLSSNRTCRQAFKMVGRQASTLNKTEAASFPFLRSRDKIPGKYP